MAKLADAIALGAIGATLGGSNPLPPIRLSKSELRHLALNGIAQVPRLLRGSSSAG